MIVEVHISEGVNVLPIKNEDVDFIKLSEAVMGRALYDNCGFTRISWQISVGV